MPNFHAWLGKERRQYTDVHIKYQINKIQNIIQLIDLVEFRLKTAVQKSNWQKFEKIK